MGARYVMAIMFAGTYCLIMVLCTLALWQKVLTVTEYVAILATFAVIVKGVADAYFSRQDRSKPEVKP